MMISTFHDEILAHIWMRRDETRRDVVCAMMISSLLGRKGVVASHLFLDEGSKDARMPKK
jgi:hypothetical protein